MSEGAFTSGLSSAVENDSEAFPRSPSEALKRRHIPKELIDPPVVFVASRYCGCIIGAATLEVIIRDAKWLRRWQKDNLTITVRREVVELPTECEECHERRVRRNA